LNEKNNNDIWTYSDRTEKEEKEKRKKGFDHLKKW
jgi:hypothetical protein